MTNEELFSVVKTEFGVKLSFNGSILIVKYPTENVITININKPEFPNDDKILNKKIYHFIKKFSSPNE